MRIGIRRILSSLSLCGVCVLIVGVGRNVGCRVLLRVKHDNHKSLVYGVCCVVFTAIWGFVNLTCGLSVFNNVQRM